MLERSWSGEPTAGQFDAVASGIADADSRVIRPYEEAGATWWFETDEGFEGWEGGCSNGSGRVLHMSDDE